MKGGRHVHVHVVQKGDTLWKIARQYGVSFDEVKRMNAHLANPDYIVPGMKIFVPEKAAKMQEKTEHPFYDGRPVKSLKEEVVLPSKKTITQPTPPPPVAQPIPQPIPQPMPQPVAQPMPQPMPYPYPISQDISMTSIMQSPLMGVPYGWMPIPDVDVAHVPQPLPPKPMPIPPKTLPLPTKVMPQPVKPVHPPCPPVLPTQMPGWQLDDSSSLGYDESSSLELPVQPQYTQAPQASHYTPCGCGQPQYDQYIHQPSPCGCGNVDYNHHQYPSQTLGESQQPYMPMQHQNPYMMAPQMMPHTAQQMAPYMACTPCHMWPAPQGQWGFPVRYN